MKKVCLHCGQIYTGFTRTKYCNRNCYVQSSSFLKMASENGKKTVHVIKGKVQNNGYYMVYVPNHPFAKKTAPKGYIYEHRIVLENELGRILQPFEIVHHKNGIKTDNRPQNLLLTTRKEHMHIHDLQRNIKGQITKVGLRI